MATLTSLIEATLPLADDDIFSIVDVSDTLSAPTGTNKKLTYSSLKTELSGVYQEKIAAATTDKYYRGDKTFVSIDKTTVALGNVDNIADANKPVSGPQLAALELKANLLSPIFCGTPSAPTTANAINNTQIATCEFVHNLIDERAVDFTVGPNSIDNVNLKIGSVYGNVIQSYAITTSKIEDSTSAITGVTTIKIATGAVTTDKLDAGAVTTDKLGFGAVLSSNINNNAVTTNKIANGAVTLGKLHESVKLQSDTIVNIPRTIDGTPITASQIQSLISAQPVDLNGYTLTFLFETGEYIINSQIAFSRFFGGVVNIQGALGLPDSLMIGYVMRKTSIIYTGTSSCFLLENSANVNVDRLLFDHKQQVQTGPLLEIKNTLIAKITLCVFYKSSLTLTDTPIVTPSTPAAGTLISTHGATHLFVEKSSFGNCHTAIALNKGGQASFTDNSTFNEIVELARYAAGRILPYGYGANPSPTDTISGTHLRNSLSAALAITQEDPSDELNQLITPRFGIGDIIGWDDPAAVPYSTGALLINATNASGAGTVVTATSGLSSMGLEKNTIVMRGNNGNVNLTCNNASSAALTIRNTGNILDGSAYTIFALGGGPIYSGTQESSAFIGYATGSGHSAFQAIGQKGFTYTSPSSNEGTGVAFSAGYSDPGGIDFLRIKDNGQILIGGGSPQYNPPTTKIFSWNRAFDSQAATIALTDVPQTFSGLQQFSTRPTISAVDAPGPTGIITRRDADNTMALNYLRGMYVWSNKHSDYSNSGTVSTDNAVIRLAAIQSTSSTALLRSNASYIRDWHLPTETRGAVNWSYRTIYTIRILPIDISGSATVARFSLGQPYNLTTAVDFSSGNKGIGFKIVDGLVYVQVASGAAVITTSTGITLAAKDYDLTLDSNGTGGWTAYINGLSVASSTFGAPTGLGSSGENALCLSLINGTSAIERSLYIIDQKTLQIS